MIQKVYINIIVELSVQTGGNFYFSSEIIKNKKSVFYSKDKLFQILGAMY